MNDDMLSQDEINELLKGIEEEKNNEEIEAEMQSSATGRREELKLEEFLSPVEQDALGEIGNISFGSAATALSTLLNQKVDITTPQVSMIKRQYLEEEFPKPHVAVHVEYTAGFEGTNLLVIKTEDAAVISDLMMGGDGTSPVEELSDMHISAVQEAMNQMMGSASTSMSTIFNKKVDISPPGIDLMDIKKNEGIGNLPNDDILVKISFKLKIGELINSSIMQLVTVPFAKQLVEELMNPESSLVDEMISEKVANEELSAPELKQAEREYEKPVPPSYSSNESDYEQRGQQHIGTPFNEREVDIQPAAFSSFSPPELSSNETKNLNMLLDIPLQVTVELGRTKRSIKEILEFTQGSIIELDKLAGEPVDILINQKLIAKGEVVVIDENFGVRVTEIVSQEDRLKRLR